MSQAGGHDTAEGTIAEASGELADVISLAEAAERLGVHYMTAYRYVRTGRLLAEKQSGMWWVRPADLDLLDVARLRNRDGGADGTTKHALLSSRLRARLEAGDEGGAWSIINEALTHGMAAREVHTLVIGPAMVEIGEGWARGEVSIAAEHEASATLTRVLGRMSSLFRRPGRRSATVVVASVVGDHHALSTSLITDLLCDAGLAVRNLGPNMPTEGIIDVVSQIDSPVAIGLSCSCDDTVPALVLATKELRRVFPDTGLFVGGAAHQAFGDLDADAIATSGAEAVDLIVEHFDTLRTA